uniref:Uncharacterized protein n=1 Tax=Glossina brevipalpis TaxID=37001 RepID=A0A1A9WQ90_9MUSC
MFALQPTSTIGTVVAPWSGSMIDRLPSLEDMPPKDNVISMKNIPCLGVASSGGDVGAAGITTGKAATAVLDPTTAEATTTPHASTYFASTYYHLNDDECMLTQKIKLYLKCHLKLVYSLAFIYTNTFSLYIRIRIYIYIYIYIYIHIYMYESKYTHVYSILTSVYMQPLCHSMGACDIVSRNHHLKCIFYHVTCRNVFTYIVSCIKANYFFTSI